MGKINKVFRTIIEPAKYDFEIKYESKMMFIGSCFTENIGVKLNELKFDIDINPFGILYNPASVKYALQFIIEKKIFSENDLFYFNESWHSYFHHGDFSSTDLNDSLNKINSRINAAHNDFSNLKYLFITFGTAWVYESKESKQIVSNCHKVPNNKFEKNLLSVENIYEKYKELINKISEYNSDLKIIFTISPIRHIKDGFTENFLSKSILRTAIDNLLKEFKNCFYFPAYEILIDDLRDYRFYKSDMIHPSEEAINYIFDFFRKTFFSDQTEHIIERINKLLKAKEHRPFNPHSKEYSTFKKRISKQIDQLNREYPFLNFE